MPKTNLLRQMAGSLVYDVPRYFFNLWPLSLSTPTPSWIFVRNRNEELIGGESQLGVKCNWQWTSDLHLPKVFPIFGKWLLNRAVKDYPIILFDKLVDNKKKPDVSFLIGHRGVERLPLLLMTLKSIAGQKDCRIECIVVEQDNEPHIKDDLPDWVRYIHTPLPKKDMAYSRSWAFNVGAKVASADFLVFHDNDMLVPEVYANDLLKYFRQGYDFINLKRFIFYLDQVSSEELIDASDLGKKPEIGAIVQNLEAGGSFGANRKSYFDIGGFDERFVGWGGEDNEFWERANTRRVYQFGYMPIVHLWHPAQPGKNNRLSTPYNGVAMYQRLRTQSVKDRIKKLTDFQ